MSNHGYPRLCGGTFRNGEIEITKAVRYFSKLGNTKTIAEAIAQGAGVPAVSVTEEPELKESVVITLVLAFVFLHEEFTTKSLIGCILIGAGTLVMVL